MRKLAHLSDRPRVHMRGSRGNSLVSRAAEGVDVASVWFAVDTGTVVRVMSPP